MAKTAQPDPIGPVPEGWSPSDASAFAQFNESRKRRGLRPATPQEWVSWGKPPESGVIFQPGIPTPTIQPFFTGDDLLQINEFLADFNRQMGFGDTPGELDLQLDRARIDTDRQKKEFDRQAHEAKVQTTDEMIGRGLFRSSIRDADLADIDRANAARKQILDTALGRLTIDTDIQKRRLQESKRRFDEAMARKAAENAINANQGQPPFLREPAWVPNPQAKESTGKKGVTWAVWHRWDEGQRQRYRERHRHEWEAYRPH